jgi:hypothetical protein
MLRKTLGDLMTGSTMLIEVRTDSNIQGNERFSDHVKTVVQTALDRYGDRIRRVDVHLSDAVGNKAGHDANAARSKRVAMAVSPIDGGVRP